MKIVLQDRNQYIIRFDKGEEVLDGLKKFMSEQSVTACGFVGIGACSEVELGYYNSHLKDYRKKPYLENLEIISLTGNGSISEGQPAIHAHGMFGRNDFTVLGGHVFKILTEVTCEIFLSKLDGALARARSDEFNLNLLA